MSLECKIYQRELRVLGYGLPLYEPNPAEYDRVRVGDVGIAEKDGYFRRIFNALPHLDPYVDDINATYGLPESFEPLPEACRAVTTRNEISAGSWLRSDHVVQIEGDFDFSMSSVSAGARVNFIVNNRQAAALRIKHSAERVNASRLALYRAYMLKHYKTWERFIRNLGFEFELRDIILVTGHDLTANWATATLIERASQGGITMQAGDSVILGASTSISGTTESSIRIPIRIGPNPYNPPRRLTHLSIEDSEAVPVKDQCIYLRGFRVSEKLFVPRIMKAEAEPRGLDSNRDSDANTGVVSVEFDSDEDVQAGEEFVDHNFVLNAILQTDAEIAIVHETDICTLAKMTRNSTHGMNGASDFRDNGMVLDIEFNETLRKKVGTMRQVPSKAERDIGPSGTFTSHRLLESTRRAPRVPEVENEPNDAKDTPSSVVTDETLVSSTPSSTNLLKFVTGAAEKAKSVLYKSMNAIYRLQGSEVGEPNHANLLPVRASIPTQSPDVFKSQAEAALRRLEEARLHERCPEACKSCSQKHRKCQFKTGHYPKCDLCAKNNQKCEIIPNPNPITHNRRAVGSTFPTQAQQTVLYGYSSGSTTQSLNHSDESYATASPATSLIDARSMRGNPPRSHPYSRSIFYQYGPTASGQLHHGEAMMGTQTQYCGQYGSVQGNNPGLVQHQGRTPHQYYLPSQGYIQSSTATFAPSATDWPESRGDGSAIGQSCGYPSSPSPVHQSSATSVPRIHTDASYDG